MKKSLAVLALSLIGLVSMPAYSDKYIVDTKGAHASINFVIKHLGYSYIIGRFNSFSGEFTYDPENIAASTVSVTIDTRSVDSNHAERDKHLRSSDFLNADKNPKATFMSKKVVLDDDGTFKITGDLTLNAVTRSIIIAAEKVGEGKDPWGGYRVGFVGETEFALKDYNITKDLGPASQMIKLELHIEGVRQ